ncbi:MAG TPA: putative Ig domain-containing protein, partial [Solirubrobacteraceae bacterium]|nr:putative Ig domain-containing protein [Solirubrobacteraceae bacterium]
PTTAVVGTIYSFQPSGADTDGDTLTYSVQNLPVWATFDASSGRLTGTPADSDVGATLAITITVSDGQSSASLNPFEIQVSAPPTSPPPPSGPTNSPPTISGQPATSVHVGSKYSFQPSASDPDGDTLSFSIKNTPSWATFNAASGLLSGTPGSAAVGTYSGIEISVSDGQNTVSLPVFSIQVLAASSPPPTNSAPTITGTPGTQVQAGQTYSFTPTAADKDGNKLTFSIQNKPAWANFSTSTGQLSGTPSSTNVGSDSGIVISVSDGTTSASLPAFTISVTSPPPPTTSTGSATLNWTTPAQNTDGSALTNLAGYIIVYGTSSSALTETVSVQDPSATSYTISGLASGTWYFALVTVAASGEQSPPTNLVSTTIP